MVVHAEVNHGRWIAKCPWCPGAEDVIGSVFTCASCGGRAEVVMPSEAQEIARLLALRPLKENRNWLPGESIAQLQAENLEHAVPV